MTLDKHYKQKSFISLKALTHEITVMIKWAVLITEYWGKRQYITNKK